MRVLTNLLGGGLSSLRLLLLLLDSRRIPNCADLEFQLNGLAKMRLQRSRCKRRQLSNR